MDDYTKGYLAGLQKAQQLVNDAAVSERRRQDSMREKPLAQAPQGLVGIYTRLSLRGPVEHVTRLRELVWNYMVMSYGSAERVVQEAYDSEMKKHDPFYDPLTPKRTPKRTPIKRIKK